MTHFAREDLKGTEVRQPRVALTDCPLGERSPGDAAAQPARDTDLPREGGEAAPFPVSGPVAARPQGGEAPERDAFHKQQGLSRRSL